MTDSPGAAAARAALAESVHKNRTEVTLAGETITLLRDEIRMSVAEAVRDGIAGAMTPDAARAFCGVLVQVLQEQAAQTAGQMVLGGLWTLTKRLFWAGMFVAALFYVVGWPGVKLLLASAFNGKG